VIELHDAIAPGDPVVVMATATELPEPARSRFHYAGVGGGGMSALAQFQAWLGGTWSARHFVADENAETDGDNQQIEVECLKDNPR
jgi:hypothetical protein